MGTTKDPKDPLHPTTAEEHPRQHSQAKYTGQDQPINGGGLGIIDLASVWRKRVLYLVQ